MFNLLNFSNEGLNRDPLLYKCFYNSLHFAVLWKREVHEKIILLVWTKQVYTFIVKEKLLLRKILSIKALTAYSCFNWEERHSLYNIFMKETQDKRLLGMTRSQFTHYRKYWKKQSRNANSNNFNFESFCKVTWLSIKVSYACNVLCWKYIALNDCSKWIFLIAAAVVLWLIFWNDIPLIRKDFEGQQENK